ncbi:MAG TPA: acyltransferase [Geomonas sp.]|nr:acyltransferase [Geomonas sp.]
MRRCINWLSSKAARDTSSGQFIPEIDGLRFIAIASVVLFHLNWFITSKTGREEGAIALSRFLSHGDVGVRLFFVISGFVIALPFAKGHLSGGRVPRLRDYLLRRLTRLEPPYIINLLIRFLLLTFLMGQAPGDLLPHLLASICYLHNIVYGAMSSVNFVAWSLEIELQFYLLAPLIACLFLIRSKALRRLLLVALIALFSGLSYAVAGSPRFSLSILSSAQFFLTGFLLVDIYLADWRQRPALSLRWDLVSALGWSSVIALLYLGKAAEAFLAVPVFVAYLAAFRGSLSNRFFRQPAVYIIGGMCYTIYLYHYSVISALVRPLLGLSFWSRLPLWLELTGASLILLPAILLVCTLMFVLIEKPCMKRDWYLRLFDRFKEDTVRSPLS